MGSAFLLTIRDTVSCIKKGMSVAAAAVVTATVDLVMFLVTATVDLVMCLVTATVDLNSFLFKINTFESTFLFIFCVDTVLRFKPFSDAESSLNQGGGSLHSFFARGFENLKK